MWIGICCFFAGAFIAAAVLAFVMGARKLEEEREELAYQQRINERLQEILDGEPT